MSSYDKDTNQLIDCKYMTVTENTAKTLAETGLAYSSGNVVKAFLWENMTTLKPLCESKSVTIAAE